MNIIREYPIQLLCPYCKQQEYHSRNECSHIGSNMLNTYQCSICFLTHKLERTMKEHNDETLLYFRNDKTDLPPKKESASE
jgi:hypothetical protein